MRQKTKLWSYVLLDLLSPLITPAAICSTCSPQFGEKNVFRKCRRAIKFVFISNFYTVITIYISNRRKGKVFYCSFLTHARQFVRFLYNTTKKPFTEIYNLIVSCTWKKQNSKRAFRSYSHEHGYLCFLNHSSLLEHIVEYLVRSKCRRFSKSLVLRLQSAKQWKYSPPTWRNNARSSKCPYLWYFNKIQTYNLILPRNKTKCIYRKARGEKSKLGRKTTF